MKKYWWLALVAIGAVAIIIYLNSGNNNVAQKAANPIPPAVSNYQYKDLVRIKKPLPNNVISSPLLVEGEARGNWFFEASFPIKLKDANGQDVPLDPPYVMTANNWMTTDYVPFSTSHTFVKPATPTGFLIFVKDNPSGEPQNDDSFQIPITFAP